MKTLEKKVKIPSGRRSEVEDLDLEGQKILGVYVLDEEGDVGFAIETDKGVHWFENYGDCCSHTYTSDVIVSPSISYDLGYVCTGVYEMEMEDDEEVKGTTQECDSIYGYEIRFAEGSLFITYRNSSNGYYGGSVYYTGEYKGDIKALVRVDKHFISKNI